MEFQKRVSLGLFFCLTVANSIESSRADEVSHVLSRQTVTGKVSYEPRYTRVMDQVCEGSPCKKSQMYWSLVIQSGGAQYLLDEKLNLGKTRAPSVMELGGVQVSPGSVVQLDGDVVDYGVRLYSIQKVHRVELLTDLGWACYNLGGGSSNIYARVWHDPLSGPQVEGKENYKMRVQEVINRTVRPIAFIEQANLAVRSNQWVFKGQSALPQSVEVELEISESSPNALTAPAQLKMKRKRLEALVDAPAETIESSSIEMSCSRTRTDLSLDME